MSDDLVVAEGVRKSFDSHHGLLRKSRIEAVKGVDLSIARGEAVSVVGESGSGKSTLGRILVRLLEPSAGSVLFDGQDIANLKGRGLRHFRQRVGIVFQNPYRSLNPRMRVQQTLAEPLRVWNVVPSEERAAEVGRLLEAVGLPPEYALRYPHEMSGGERQRIAIARSLAVRPEFMVADEAVSSLDVSAQAEVLNLLLRLRRELGLTLLFVTHDLDVARVLADRIVVMKSGEIVESGTDEDIFEHSTNPYTELLLHSKVSLPSTTEPQSHEAAGERAPGST